MKVLELYSGIGGMHFALKCSGIAGEVKASIDINPVANSVYKHNFPEVLLLNRNVQSLTPSFINKLDVDTILMSPPCQPFTRNGLQRDVIDDRTLSFIYILEILPELKVQSILVENVKGFEVSQMRNLLIEALRNCDFSYQEFILSPSQVSVPNTRHRYYCLAKKRPREFSFEPGPLKTEMPALSWEFHFMDEIRENVPCIGEFLDDSENFDSYYLGDKILRKYVTILDICHSTSTNSCCFTKAYGRYMEGTGSVFTENTEEFVKAIFKQMEKCEVDDPHRLELARELKLRFFTPGEVSRLMSFPGIFSFPESLRNRQKYMLLGNSINVKVVAKLLRLLQ